MPVTRQSARRGLSAVSTQAEEGDDGDVMYDAHASRRKRSRETSELGIAPKLSQAPLRCSKAGEDQQPPNSRSRSSKKAKISEQLTIQAAEAANGTNNGSQSVFWLLKAEPLPRFENGVNVAFSIDDLARCTVPEPWSGVRNPQARNNMQAMRKDDLGFFYHSNAKPSGIAGVLRVVEEATVDETAFDDKDPYYDPKSDRSRPKWFCVGVEFVRKFDHMVDLHTIKSHAAAGGPLASLQLVTNSRLSVCKVHREEWEFLLQLADKRQA